MHLLAAAAASAALLPPAAAPLARPVHASVPPASKALSTTEPAAPAPARPSRAVGRPWRGRLVGGVQVPAEGTDFFTWNPARKSSPNAPWRRWATARTVATTLRVIAQFRAANPTAPRVGIGDLSRPRGGPFGPGIAGGLGHVSHQNGLDVDIYYPRTDRLEYAPRGPRAVDRALAQDLVSRLVAAGGRPVFVGPRLGLRGPRRIVQPLVHHDDHLHVRFAR